MEHAHEVDANGSGNLHENPSWEVNVAVSTQANNCETYKYITQQPTFMERGQRSISTLRSWGKVREHDA